LPAPHVDALWRSEYIVRQKQQDPGPVSRVFAGRVGADYTPFLVCNFEGPFFG
jgi:hypothetical protein